MISDPPVGDDENLPPADPEPETVAQDDPAPPADDAPTDPVDPSDEADAGDPPAPAAEA